MTTYSPVFRDINELDARVSLEVAFSEITGYDDGEGPIAFRREDGSDASQEVATAWLKAHGREWMQKFEEPCEQWPEFINLHAAPEAYALECELTDPSDEEYSVIHSMLVRERAARQGAVS